MSFIKLLLFRDSKFLLCLFLIEINFVELVNHLVVFDKWNNLCIEKFFELFTGVTMRGFLSIDLDTFNLSVFYLCKGWAEPDRELITGRGEGYREENQKDYDIEELTGRACINPSGMTLGYHTPDLCRLVGLYCLFCEPIENEMRTVGKAIDNCLAEVGFSQIEWGNIAIDTCNEKRS